MEPVQLAGIGVTVDRTLCPFAIQGIDAEDANSTRIVT
jgi:hypothetical protein